MFYEQYNTVEQFCNFVIGTGIGTCLGQADLKILVSFAFEFLCVQAKLIYTRETGILGLNYTCITFEDLL